jgi:hypothetical protein
MGVRDGEDAAERADRELIELLNELRVALPGVQVLFAFLLTVPFTQRFTELSEADVRVYYIAVLTTAAATLLLIAPSAHHRIRFRSGVKEQLLRVANVLAIAGLALLAVAISAVVYLISGLLYSDTEARIATGVLVGAFLLIWFLLPLAYRPGRTPPSGRRDEG